MSPEVATTKPWRELFSSTTFAPNLVLVAIDEAHCITEWYVFIATSYMRYLIGVQTFVKLLED